MNKLNISNTISGQLVTFLVLTCACVFASFCVAVLVSYVLNDKMVAMLVSQAIITLGSFVVPAWGMKRLYPKDENDVKLMSDFQPVSLRCVAVAVLALLFALPFLNWMGTYTEMVFPASVEQQEQMFSLLTDGGVGMLVARLVVVAFLAAICEELFFRGTLQRVFTENIQKKSDVLMDCENDTASANTTKSLCGVILTALIFSLAHFDMSGFFQRFVLGCYLGFAFYWTKSLWTSFAMHFANNGLLVLAFYYLPVPEKFGCELDFIGVDCPILAFLCLFVSLCCMYLLKRLDSK